MCRKWQGCPEAKILCRQFLSPFKFFGFKEWNLSVAEAVAIKPHLFFIFHSSLGKKEKEKDNLRKEIGRNAKFWAALFSKRWTMQRCFSFYNHFGVSCPVKWLLKSLFFCNHKCLYYDPRENSHKTHSCEEFHVICLMGPRYITYTGAGLYLIPRHLKGVHPRILSAQSNYKTLAEAELQRCFYSSKLLFLSCLLCLVSRR